MLPCGAVEAGEHYRWRHSPPTGWWNRCGTDSTTPAPALWRRSSTTKRSSRAPAPRRAPICGSTLLPGMYHHRGGPGADTFDSLAAIDEWVEQGKAPETLLATRADAKLSRPLCRYPALYPTTRGAATRPRPRASTARGRGKGLQGRRRRGREGDGQRGRQDVLAFATAIWADRLDRGLRSARP